MKRNAQARIAEAPCRPSRSKSALLRTTSGKPKTVGHASDDTELQRIVHDMVGAVQNLYNCISMVTLNEAVTDVNADIHTRMAKEAGVLVRLVSELRTSIRSEP